MLLGILTSPLAAEPMLCPDPLFAVSAADDSMVRRLCSIAGEIRGHLETCALTQSRNLTVEITDDASHPLASCLAYYDCEYEVVRIADPVGWDALLEQDQAYASLPEDIILKALLTHEITHATVTQMAGERKVPMVDQEYIAASMELEFMQDDWREVLLAIAPVELPPKEGLIDIWIYGFAPRKFAVNAWQHFRLPENGCALVQRIVRGEASFAKSARPDLR